LDVCAGNAAACAHEHKGGDKDGNNGYIRNKPVSFHEQFLLFGGKIPRFLLYLRTGKPSHQQKGKLGPVANAGFFVYVFHMRLDGVAGKIDALGDLSVVFALYERVNDFRLPL
jgi:hypothetical protein